MSIRCTLPLALLACSAPLLAQELKYIDLTASPQRTELRHPPAPQDCEDGAPCVGGGYGGLSVTDGAPDTRDPRALGVYLLSVTPTEINTAEPFEVELRVLNTGLAPIELPVSPHLSDLQPSDEYLAFSYLSLALDAHISDEGMRGSARVELYGSTDHEDSTLVLEPGEWIRIRANVRFNQWPSEPVSAHLRGESWLQRKTFYPHPGGGSTDVQNLYPNATPTPAVAVRLFHAKRSTAPKQ
jgi:hypothetical protein